MIKSHKMFAIAISVMLALGISACTTQGNNAQRLRRNENTPRISRISGEFIRDTNRTSPPNVAVTPQPGPMKNNNQIMGFDGQKANNIRQQLGSIRDIKDLNTIVFGDTALIGYNLNKTVRDSNGMKKMITDRVKQMDGTIKNVVVTDTGDFSMQIKQLSDRINKSKPGNALNTEFQRLMRTINPERSKAK